MRNILRTFAAFLMLAGSALAITDPFYIYIGNAISVSSTNTNQAFTNNHSGGDSAAFIASEVLVCNVGAVTMFVDLDGVAVANTDEQILAGECRSYGSAETPISNIGLITASSTTTARVRATRPKAQ